MVQFSSKCLTFVRHDRFCPMHTVYVLLDIFFVIFHTSLTLFNALGWAWKKNPRMEPHHPSSHRFFMAFSGDDCRRSRLLSAYRLAFQRIRETGRNQPPQFLPQVSFRPHHRSRYQFRSCRPRNAHRVCRRIRPFPFPQPPRQNPFKTHKAQGRFYSFSTVISSIQRS